MIAEIDNLDNAQGWVPLFHKLNWLAREKGGSVKDAKLPENRTLNRYRDVLPYDHSRIILKSKEGGTDYVNANLVEIPEVNRRYILSQGPLPHTAGHFWQMVWENDTKAIIMLNKTIEKNQVKCFQYWPCGEANDHTNELEFDNFKITYLSENKSELFTVRTLQLQNTETEESRDVYHFHYQTWPDFGVPRSPANFLQFLFEARNAGVLSSDVGPAVIHCSAGIGRSGTYIMVDSILAEVEAKQDLINIDLQKRLLEVRHYRIGLIQTPDQLRFTYIAILEGTLALMPDVYQVAFDAFIAEKEKTLTEQDKPEEQDEEPPPLPPRRKRPDEEDETKEAEVPEKRPCKSLPDLPEDQDDHEDHEDHNDHEDAEKPSAPLQEDDLSSDGSGEDEIIDLSASLSSSTSEEGTSDIESDTQEGDSPEAVEETSGTKEPEESRTVESNIAPVITEVDQTTDLDIRGVDTSKAAENEHVDSKSKLETENGDIGDLSATVEQDNDKIITPEADVGLQQESEVQLEASNEVGDLCETGGKDNDEMITPEADVDLQQEPEVPLEASNEVESRPDSGIIEDQLSELKKQDVESTGDAQESTETESRPESGISDPSSLESPDITAEADDGISEVQKRKRSCNSDNEGNDKVVSDKKSECSDKAETPDVPKEDSQKSEDDKRETELRKRKWKEKQAKTAELVGKIKSNVRKEEESRAGYGPLVKKVLIFVAVCSVAYIAYRMFNYYFGQASVKIRPKRKKH